MSLLWRCAFGRQSAGCLQETTQQDSWPSKLDSQSVGNNSGQPIEPTSAHFSGYYKVLLGKLQSNPTKTINLMVRDNYAAQNRTNATVLTLRLSMRPLGAQAYAINSAAHEPVYQLHNSPKGMQTQDPVIPHM